MRRSLPGPSSCPNRGHPPFRRLGSSRTVVGTASARPVKFVGVTHHHAQRESFNRMRDDALKVIVPNVGAVTHHHAQYLSDAICVMMRQGLPRPYTLI